jgi:Uma2 family endonuclease
MSALPKTYISISDYLAGERLSDTKHEYYDGEVFAFAGGSEQHNLIAGNVYASLHSQLRKRPCTVYPSDMRVKIPRTGLYTYPDVVAVCGTAYFEDAERDTLLNPTVIVEVLSPSTEKYDRGKKFQNYRTVDSLIEYVLIAQDTYRIEHYVRQPDQQWLLSEATSLEDIIELPSIQCILVLADVYEKVRIEDEAGSA